MIKNIIFDFGAVLIPIEEKRSWEAFKLLGAKPELEQQSETFEAFETGKLTSAEFIAKIQPFFHRRIFPGDLADAWNKLLDPLPQEIVPFLKKLKKDYRLFLLSNTNELHIQRIKDEAGPFHYGQFIRQFQKLYYSYEVGLRKPDKEIFEKVLKENDLDPEETFYVDDSNKHLKAAAKLGIHTWHFKPEKDSILDLKKKMEELSK